MNPVVTTRLRLQCQLGEGLHWDDARRCLWMVDIQGRRILRWDGDGAAWQEWSTPQRVGWVLPVPGHEALLAGLQEGMAWLRLEAGREPVPEWVARPFEGRPELRLNDAKMDRTGAVWAGSLNNDDEQQDDGCLFRLAPDGTLSVLDTGYKVCNGPAIRPDERLLLHSDSARRIIYAFDLDVLSGRLSGKRVWKRFADGEGYPDGMNFDAQGRLWVAHWGAGCISCFSADGDLLRRIAVPAPHVTNVCFGGARRDRLFVSSARVGLDAAALAAHPSSGDLFEVMDWD